MNSSNDEFLNQSQQFEDQCEKAADAIAEADVLVLVTGAGWGADSGLKVFAEVAKIPAYQKRGMQYADASKPELIVKDPELFYGFWGDAFNTYRTTKPHEGFDIVARWRDDKNQANGHMVANKIRDRVKEKVEARCPFQDEKTKRQTPYEADGTSGAFFAFTSNVDAHHYDVFEAHEIHDCHGSVELWQCSDRDCDSGIWRAPTEFMFNVDQETMLAPSKKREASDTSLRNGGLLNLPESSDKVGWYQDDSESNWPKCGHCQKLGLSRLARPSILMFGDHGWKWDLSQEIRWDLWRETIVEMATSVNVCIVEVGCGTTVATCRNTSEYFIRDLLDKGGRASLVRINPDFPSTTDPTIQKNITPIMSTGLKAVMKIDQLYAERHGKS
ncbi:expressed unknown protein [Seminavis robusta]|uniref:Deacetylase sirtuin-type domain-containing protein n=1 Tax=Seminavis robusta TaxID=568900 RepID=A0A9N8EH06_9STRA|nr:expressed unknown protein [Seminavis robusta]|eukprot:Sro1151_g246710.1 n/a (386) ;mRNA; f:3855-5012